MREERYDIVGLRVHRQKFHRHGIDLNSRSS